MEGRGLRGEARESKTKTTNTTFTLCSLLYFEFTQVCKSVVRHSNLARFLGARRFIDSNRSYEVPKRVTEACIDI